MKYHVTPKWDGENLQPAARRLGEEEAIEMFCAKWDTEDTSYAADQVWKVFMYATIEEARDHVDNFGGEILAINDEWLDIFEDMTEGQPVLATRNDIDAKDIIGIVG